MDTTVNVAQISLAVAQFSVAARQYCRILKAKH
jgi:hypothetical protein